MQDYTPQFNKSYLVLSWQRNKAVASLDGCPDLLEMKKHAVEFALSVPRPDEHETVPVSADLYVLKPRSYLFFVRFPNTGANSQSLESAEGGSCVHNFTCRGWCKLDKSDFLVTHCCENCGLIRRVVVDLSTCYISSIKYDKPLLAINTQESPST